MIARPEMLTAPGNGPISPQSAGSQCSSSDSSNQKRRRLADVPLEPEVTSTSSASGHGNLVVRRSEVTGMVEAAPGKKVVETQLVGLASSLGILQAQARASRAQAVKARGETQRLQALQEGMQADIVRCSHAAMRAALCLEAGATSVPGQDHFELLAWASCLKDSLAQMVSLAEGGTGRGKSQQRKRCSGDR